MNKCLSETNKNVLDFTQFRLKKQELVSSQISAPPPPSVLDQRSELGGNMENIKKRIQNINNIMKELRTLCPL